MNVPTLPPGKRMIPVFVDESIYREIKVYAAETDATMQKVIQSLTEEFTQGALKLVSDIREMKRRAEEQRKKQEEEAKIVAENPLPVTGMPVDPIGETIEPKTC